MKLSWHLLFLALAIAAAILVGNMLNAPLWQIRDARFVNYDKFNEAHKEWSVIVGDQEKKNWWIETRRGRDSTVIRRLKLELPPLPENYLYYGMLASLFMNHSCSDAIVCSECPNSFMVSGSPIRR